MEPGYVSPWVKEQAFVVSADNDVKDLVAGTRSLTIKVDHPGLIWTSTFLVRFLRSIHRLTDTPVSHRL
jgi:hypothetical protein